MQLCPKYRSNKKNGKKTQYYNVTHTSSYHHSVSSQYSVLSFSVISSTASDVQEDVDCGAIVLQEAVNVTRGDTEHSLSERVKLAEHRIYPEALELLASGAVSLDSSDKLLWHWVDQRITLGVTIALYGGSEDDE